MKASPIVPKISWPSLIFIYGNMKENGSGRNYGWKEKGVLKFYDGNYFFTD